MRAGALSILAIHSATDSCYGWDDYGALVGARFDGHPWTQTFTADVLDPSHPACAHLGDAWEWHDEVYQFRDLRPDAHLLLRVRDGELDLDAPGARPPSFGYPLAWCFGEGAGRVFSTTLGHFPSAWESPDLPPPPRRRLGVDALGVTRHSPSDCSGSGRCPAITAKYASPPPSAGSARSSSAVRRLLIARTASHGVTCKVQPASAS